MYTDPSCDHWLSDDEYLATVPLTTPPPRQSCSVAADIADTRLTPKRAERLSAANCRRPPPLVVAGGGEGGRRRNQKRENEYVSAGNKNQPKLRQNYGTAKKVSGEPLK